MNAFYAYFKKEVCEVTRTYKLTVMGLVFLLFGIMNPLTAKLLPEIMASVMPEGMSITLPEPSAMDSWAQFFKNVSQMGLIVLVVLFSGAMAGEFSRSTLIQPLTKGLARRVTLAAKFLAIALFWTTRCWPAR
jgi:ABC-2 type transport system permease protein